jgi:hypothetical protein
MIRQLLFPLILLVGAYFNGYVMPRRILRQVADGSISPKIGSRFCILWRCWGTVFLAVSILTLYLAFRRK